MGINSVINETTFIAYAREVGCIVTINGNLILVTYTDGTQVQLERGKNNTYYRETAKLLY